MMKRPRRRTRAATVLILVGITVFLLPGQPLKRIKLFTLSASLGFLELTGLSREHITEAEALREVNSRLTVLLKEKESEIRTLKKEMVHSAAAADIIPASYQALSGTVLFYDPSPGGDTVLINRGSSHGAGPGDIVLEGGFLIGRVTHVDDETCTALLISDPRSSFSVSVGRESLTAVCRGNGKGRSLSLLYIDNQPENVLHKGDTAVTSGFTPGVPAGVPVGEIANEPQQDTREYDPFLAIRLRPFVNTLSLRHVYILVPQQAAE
jgi:rod shape-determining protein MreC